MENTISKLEQLTQYIQATNDESVMSKLDSALDNISTFDYFGTEGQFDPRGDQRDAEFADHGHIDAVVDRFVPLQGVVRRAGYLMVRVSDRICHLLVLDTATAA